MCIRDRYRDAGRQNGRRNGKKSFGCGRREADRERDPVQSGAGRHGSDLRLRDVYKRQLSHLRQFLAGLRRIALFHNNSHEFQGCQGRIRHIYEKRISLSFFLIKFIWEKTEAYDTIKKLEEMSTDVYKRQAAGRLPVRWKSSFTGIF